MTNEEVLTILEKSEQCHTENCPDGVFCDECPWNVKTAEYDEAIKTIKSVLSKQCASTEQADKKLFGHGYWLMPGEVFISHNVLNEVLDTITKSINTEQRKIDSTLVKTATNDEAIRKDDHIAEPDKMVDQIREDTKMTEDVPDTNVGKTDFKPGDKFILELGAERRMFHEFEIAGTDLYVKTDLLEKLTRYEPEKFEIHNDHTDCIWYHYLDDDEPNACPSTCSQYRDGWNDAMKYIYCDGKGYQPYTRKAK